MFKKITLAQQELQTLANPKHATFYMRFFKCAKGEYTYGDRFLGIRVPQTRALAKKYHTLNDSELTQLLKSAFHEERLLGLVILVNRLRKFKNRNSNQLEFMTELKCLTTFYLKHIKAVNNWDLVDISAPDILGAYVFYFDEPKRLHTLASSHDLWERRIAMLSCFYFIRQDSLKLPLKIASQLVNDEHDLIHKAVGWMLREIGKRDTPLMIEFLKLQYTKLSRTTIRYAIEKLPPKQRNQILKGCFK